jgi:hypothetical protein
MSASPLIDDLAARHGFSPAAVEAAAAALRRSGGSQAQFSHPDLGGTGQWMPGMLMIGDMFNNQLKGRVDSLFGELSSRLNELSSPAGPSAGSPANSPPSPSSKLPPLPPLPGQHLPPPGRDGFQAAGGASFSYGCSGAQTSNWYPDELGIPASSGSQNDFRWAFFPNTRRLAIQVGRDLSVYDTEDHAIHSASQQQDSGGGHIVLTSQRGQVDVARLRKVR